MTQSNALIQTFLKAWKFWPILLLLQFSEGFAAVVEKFLEHRFDSSPILGALLFFPLFCMASTISNALTFLFLLHKQQSKPTQFKVLWKRVWDKKVPLILSSFVLGIVFLLGFAALVLPAFYFMALYLFVPQFVLTEESTVSGYLYKSKRIASKRLWLCVASVSLAFTLGLISFLASESLGNWAGGFSQIPLISFMISLCVDVFFSMLSGAVIDVWIAVLFFHLEAK